MKEIEFWVGSLTYGLSWLHVNTICSRYLRTPVPGDCWGRDATVPKARQALKGTQLSPSSGSLCFFKENSTLRGLYAIPLPICHSDSAISELELFLPENFQCKMNHANPVSILVQALQCGRPEKSPWKRSQMKLRTLYLGRERGLANSREIPDWNLCIPGQSWALFAHLKRAGTHELRGNSLTISMSCMWGTIQARQRFAFKELLLLTPG